MEPVQSKRKFVQIWDAVTLLPRPWKRFQEWIRPWKRFQEWMIWILKYKLGALSQPLCCTSAPYNCTSSHFCPFRWWFWSEADNNHRSSKQSGATGYNFCKFSKSWQHGWLNAGPRDPWPSLWQWKIILLMWKRDTPKQSWAWALEKSHTRP